MWSRGGAQRLMRWVRWSRDTHSPPITHSLTHSHSVTHSPPLPTHSLTHPPTHQVSLSQGSREGHPDPLLRQDRRHHAHARSNTRKKNNTHTNTYTDAHARSNTDALTLSHANTNTRNTHPDAIHMQTQYTCTR